MGRHSRNVGVRRAWVAVMAVTVIVGVRAQVPGVERPAINPGLGPKPPAVLRGTPVESWRTFWDACSAGQFVLAAHLLDLAEVGEGEQRRVGAEVAEKLFGLLEAMRADPDEVARRLEAVPGDGAAAGDAVSVFRFQSGDTPGEIALRRVMDRKNGETAWLISHQTVSNTAVWYRTLVQGERLAGMETLNPGLGPVPPSVHRDSPRASFSGFMDAALHGEFDVAAHFLDLEAVEPARQRARGAVLARRLMLVLLRTRAVVPGALSGDDFGVPEEGVPEHREVLAQVKANGRTVAISLGLRLDPQQGNIWTFAPETVGYVDYLYGVFGYGWVGDVLPGSFFSISFAGLQLWQWLAILLALGIGWVLAKAFQRLLVAAGGLVTRRTRTQWDDEFIRACDGPMCLILWGLLVRPASHWLSLTPTAELILGRGAQLLSLVGVGWLLFRVVDVVSGFVQRSGGEATPVGASFSAVIGRFLKAIVAIFVLLGILSVMGVDVTGLLAGLGIGGIAVAFAAQKTIENLFGAVSLGTDRPFRIGDFIAVDEIQGTVEDMGLRSLRLRTMQRTLVTIPNGVVAAAKIVNFTVRDRILYNPVLGLVYSTTPDQLALVIDEIKRMLLADPRIFPDTVRVRFRSFGSSALDVEVVAWVLTSDWHHYTGVAEELNFRILDIVHRAGSGFAFPSQSVYLTQTAPPDPAARDATAAEVSRRRGAGDWTLPEPSDETAARLRSPRSGDPPPGA
jgi:MscS family membrane protein